MANELTINASIALEDAEFASGDLAVEALMVTMATKRFIKVKHNVGTTEEAMILGDVTALGYIIAINRDVTNFVEIRVATAGTKFAKLKPNNGVALFHFGSGVTAPYLIADTGACQVEYFLCST